MIERARQGYKYRNVLVHYVGYLKCTPVLWVMVLLETPIQKGRYIFTEYMFLFKSNLKGKVAEDRCSGFASGLITCLFLSPPLSVLDVLSVGGERL